MRGFGNLGGMGSMGNAFKQAQKAMEQMQRMEQELAAIRVEGSAGGGYVKAQVTGAGMIESVEIDPQVVDPEDVEMLQDLVVSAVRDAMEKANRLKEDRIRELTGGLGIPPGIFG